MGCGALLPVFRAMLSSCLLPPARRAGLPVHDVATPCRWVVRVESIIAGSSQRGASPDACIEKNIKPYDIKQNLNLFAKRQTAPTLHTGSAPSPRPAGPVAPTRLN